ncbi:alpha/beta fold hydrolase [Flavobacterium sp.]|uniref:alpha/beta fold hydrolase n=1 Tax=Flavobacterium sp. TaxID=239 RepID=UPI0026258191|nr:alpha/beta fold hydrolase [Flavobacterium sp.]
MKKLKLFLLTKSIGGYINFLSLVYPKKAQQLAYRFFSEPRTGKLSSENLPEVLKKARKREFRFDKYTFQSYSWQGNENTILLVHGWESNAARWEKLLKFLQKTGCTVVAIDAPAHGMTTEKEFNVPRYAEFIREAVSAFQPKAIIGHSIGGAATIYHQYKFQNTSIKKLVILGAPSDLQTIIDQYITLLSLNKRSVSLLENHFIAHFNMSVSEFSATTFAKTLEIDGLIVHDTGDVVVAFSEAEKISRSWKNAQLIETKGLGHSLHDYALYQKIVDFLET